MESVVNAIGVFYSPATEADLRKESGRFLERFQNTVKQKSKQAKQPQFRLS
jgi:hypothetical protein